MKINNETELSNTAKEFICRQDAINVVAQAYRYESDRLTALQELPAICLGQLPIT